MTYQRPEVVVWYASPSDFRSDDTALCRQTDPALFFPDAGHSRDVGARAKAICLECPLQLACMDWAIEHHEWGIWGGTSDQERQEIRRGRRVIPRRKAALQ